MSKRKLAWQLMHDYVRLVDREESLALARLLRLGIFGALGRCLVQNPKGHNGRLKRLNCTYCDKKSAYSCACAPWVEGDMKPRRAMGVCSDRQGGRFMLRYKTREKQMKKGFKRKRDSWTSKQPRYAKKTSHNAVE